VLELDDREDEEEIQQYLADRVGKSHVTVPQVSDDNIEWRDEYGSWWVSYHQLGLHQSETCRWLRRCSFFGSFWNIKESYQVTLSSDLHTVLSLLPCQVYHRQHAVASFVQWIQIRCITWLQRAYNCDACDEADRIDISAVANYVKITEMTMKLSANSVSFPDNSSLRWTYKAWLRCSQLLVR
jgi:hypothetical protein